MIYTGFGQLTFPVAELIGFEVVLAAIGVLTEATGAPSVEVLRPEIFTFGSWHGSGLVQVSVVSKISYFEPFFLVD